MKQSTRRTQIFTLILVGSIFLAIAWYYGNSEPLVQMIENIVQ